MSLKKYILIILLILLALTYVFREDIAYALASNLIVNDELVKSDAITVLGGESPERVMEAVDIYKEGYGDTIVLTRGLKPEGVEELSSKGIEYDEEFERNHKVAREMGVEETKIMISKPRVEDTIEEIETIYDFVKQNDLRTVIIVTSKYHSGRTAIIADHVFGKGRNFIVRTSKYDSFSPETVLERPDHWKVMLFEYQKIVYFYLTRIF